MPESTNFKNNSEGKNEIELLKFKIIVNKLKVSVSNRKTNNLLCANFTRLLQLENEQIIVASDKEFVEI